MTSDTSRARALHVAQYCEQVAADGVLPSRAWFSESADAVRSLLQRIETLEAALRALVIDANRLCDRQHGGTYEDDCRRSIGQARAALAAEEVTREG